MAVIDERDARHGEREHGQRFRARAKVVFERAGPRIFIVVGHEQHRVGICRVVQLQLAHVAGKVGLAGDA